MNADDFWAGVTVVDAVGLLSALVLSSKRLRPGRHRACRRRRTR
jgi:hypothetical protein